VRFGIFYELQLPRPWDADAEYRVVQEALEQIEFADSIGIDYVWEVEHHFLEEYSHSSAPEVLLAAASQRTHNIRLGHGIIQTAPGYNHPARTAERIAMLDLVSGGRVEFGSGESSSIAELGGFEIDPMRKRAAWREGLETAIRCMTETPFTGVNGEFVTMPPRNVVPKPMQRPHPPLWVACSRRDTILLAAENGLGALTFAFIDPEEASGWVRDYERTLAEKCSPIGERITTELACVTPMMLHTDEHEAIARGLEGGNFFGYSLAHFYVFGDHRPGATDVWNEFQRRRSERGYSPEAAVALQQERLATRVAEAGGNAGLRGAVGTPDQVRAYLERYEEAGVDQIIFIMQAGKNRHEHIMESLETFGRDILPAFKERDEPARAAKELRLRPAIEAAMARKHRDAPALPEDFSIASPAASLLRARGGNELIEKMASDSAVGQRRRGRQPAATYDRNR